MSDCPVSVLQLLETGKLETTSLNRDERRELMKFLNGSEDGKGVRLKKVKHRETRFDRINALMKQNPRSKLTTVRVDTDNRFCYKDSKYKIDPFVKGYAPRHTRYGDQYDMDRIMVIDSGSGQLHFADQDGYAIEDNMIQTLEGEI